MPASPLLYQINTRILLTERSLELGRPASLDEVSDAFLDGLAGLGFRWIWFMGLWQTGEAGRRVSLAHPGLREEYARVLEDFTEEDVCGSPFAVRDYRTHEDFGGDGALRRLRSRMAARGLKLVADFVVNHVAPDHAWLAEHPEWFILGTERDLAASPENWTRLPAGPSRREAVVAHGRDPYFPGWPDTLQLNLRHPACREALMGELARIAGLCDGLRCDMAMLAQEDVFLRTWGDLSLPRDGAPPAGGPFWPEAIGRVKRAAPDLLFIAEAYWDREWALQEEGFDYAYDKRLYDGLRQGRARSVRDHLLAAPSFQERSVRFLENHDEPRAAAVFPADMHRAAALVAYAAPGLRFFQEGQLSGSRFRASVHLRRRRQEAPQPEWDAFYSTLLAALRRPGLMDGRWSLGGLRPAWEGNATWDQFLAFAWNRMDPPGPATLLAVVNYGPSRGQCYVRLDTAGFPGETLRFRDLFSEACFEREFRELSAAGMYFDMPPWGFHLLEILQEGAGRPPVPGLPP